MAANQAPSVHFKAGDTAYITPQVVAAFEDSGIPAITPGFGLDALIVTAGTEPPAPATPEQVSRMLREEDDWKIAVKLDASTQAGALVVVTKGDLKSRIEAAGPDPREVPAREASPSEKALFENAPKLFGPEASLDRLKASLSLPVTQAGLIGTAAGLFGLLALGDKIGHPGSMKAAVILAAVAVSMSLIGSYFLRQFTYNPARVDLIEKAYKQAVRGPLWRSRAGVLLLLAAIGAALYSVWPGTPKAKEAQVAISSAVQRSQAGFEVIIEVKWTNLDHKVALIETQATTPGETVGAAESPRGSDGTATQGLQIELETAQTLEVVTRAVDKDGVQVGQKRTRSVPVG